MIGRALQQLGWKNSDLQKRRKGDPDKLAIAEELRKQSAMTIRWIAERLHMGAPTHLSHLLTGRAAREKGSVNSIVVLGLCVG